MDNEIDEFDEETEDLENEEIVETKKSQKKKVNKPVESNVPLEKYSEFYQEQRIGIVDTTTNEVLIEGFQDVMTAKLEAIKLNKLEKIEIVSGVN